MTRPRGTRSSSRSLGVRTPAPLLGGVVLAVGLGLPAVLTAVNDDLSGPLLVAVALLGIVGVVVALEGHHRRAHRGAWIAAGAGLLALAIGYAALGPVDARDDAKARAAPAADVNRASPLRIAIVETEPPLWRLAFAEDIGVPSEQTGWRDLIARGGIPIFVDHLRFTLANRSSRPLTITDMHALLIDSQAPPHASEAHVFSQGDSPLDQFVAEFTSDAPGATAALHRVYDDEPVPSDLSAHEPFFDANYISLQPGEIYEGTLTLWARPEKLLSYRFVFAVSTPDRRFAIEDPTVHKVSGLIDQEGTVYEHSYVEGYLAWASHWSCPDVVVRRWSDEAVDCG